MILFVFACKRFFQFKTFIYVTKLKGRDGIAVYKSAFLAGLHGKFPRGRGDAS